LHTYLNKDYPIEKFRAWDVTDSSKMSDYDTCPRMYFFNHVLGWRNDTPNNHLEFGEAWHQAIEYLMLTNYSPDSIGEAYEKARNYYRKSFAKHTDELYKGKTPDGILNALIKYAELYRHDHSEYEVLFTEIAGTVPVNDERVMHFRMDSIRRNKVTGQYDSLDHKTTGTISRVWEDQFQLSVQNGTYTHALYCLYPMDQVDGVTFNGTAFKKTKVRGYEADFKRVPAWKSPRQMQNWLWNTLETIDKLDHDFERLACASDSDEVLGCFQQNTGNCTKYFGCPYHDFCCAWGNPLQHADSPPLGFRQEFWDPSEREATHVMDLKFNGGKDEKETTI